MADREPLPDIDEGAAAWAVKVDRGLTDAEQVDLDAWLAGDTRRLGAFVRAQAAWIHAERASALGLSFDALDTVPSAALDPDPSAPVRRERPGLRQRPGISRRLLLAGGGGAVAASVAAIGLLSASRAYAIESGTGEIRRLTLADGTKLVLDAETRVEVSPGTRLALVHGQLFVNAARSSAAPLTLGADGLLMRMSAGAFGVRWKADAPFAAVVTAGRLAISQRLGLLLTATTITLDSGRALTLAAGADLADGVVHTLGAGERDRLLGWRDGMLAFGGEALGRAARAFDRYGTTRIVILDPSLAAQPVAGLFRADDPRGFATAIAASFGAKVIAHGAQLRIVKESSP